jgi:uncharacterized membrane protein YphA (DoxX/SURF4 family)/peroxiredoxin
LVVVLVGRLLLAGVFAVAGVAKLIDVEGSQAAIEAFGLPRRVSRPGSVLLPALELAIATGLLVPAGSWWAAAGAAALLLLFIGAISYNLAHGRAPDCHCFGQVRARPVGPTTLFRNALLVGVAAVVLARGPGGTQTSPVAWVASLTTAELVLVGVIVLLAALVCAEGWFLSELFRQNGRILGRLQALEDAGFAGRRSPAPAPNGNGRRAGLPVGLPAPDFALPALDGEPISLADLRRAGRPALLVFSDPACGPCNDLLPALAEWQAGDDAPLTIAIVSRGERERNQLKADELALTNVLLQRDREVAERYQAHGTPSAVVVDSDGRIASELAAGPEAIRRLVDVAGSAPSVPAPAVAPARPPLRDTDRVPPVRRSR